MSEDKAHRKARAQLDKALEANKNEEAINLLVEVARFEPTSVRWPHKRGDLLRRLGRNHEAVEAYALAVDLYAEQGFIARAIAMAKTVLNLDPTRIDILERVDPNAAQQLRAQMRLSGSHAGRHPMLRDDDAPAPGSVAKRHPMLLDDDVPFAAPPTQRHPKLLDNDEPAVKATSPSAKDVPLPTAAGRPIHKRSPAAAPPAPVVSRKPPPLPPTSSKAAPPPLPAAPMSSKAAPPPLRPPSRKDAAAGQPHAPVTLDRLSLPPMAAAARAATLDLDVADIYSRALVNVDELRVDPEAPANQTRFSDPPPSGATLDVEISDVELEPRERVSEIEALRSAPPTAARLAKLPLFPLFAEVPKEALATMIAGSELIELAHGALVVREGDAGDALYGILEGSVEITLPGVRERVTFAEGDVFGEACLLQDEEVRADVVVQGKLVALRVPRDVLLSLVQYHPPLAELLLELLTRRLLGNLLQSSPLFQEFDAAGRQELGKLFEVRRAPANTQLAVAGKRMDGLYISLTGTLAISGKGIAESIARPGSMFGQNTLLSNEPSRVDVTTVVDMIVLRLPRVQFTQVAMQYPTMLERLTELATREVAKVTI